MPSDVFARNEEMLERSAIAEFDGGLSRQDADWVAIWCEHRRFPKATQPPVRYPGTDRICPVLALLDASVRP